MKSLILVPPPLAGAFGRPPRPSLMAHNHRTTALVHTQIGVSGITLPSLRMGKAMP
jgi:hypothetical protein